MEPKKNNVVLGRPRTFCLEEALDRALHLFWQKGYEGTSLSDLTEAMRINRPSLYAAFGSKEELFRKALDRYAKGPASYVEEALSKPTARAVAEYLLMGAAGKLSTPDKPHGCLLVQGALCGGEEAEPVRRELATRRVAAEAAVCRRFEQAKAEGDLPPDVDCADLARYIATISQGMSVQAAGGASCEELRRVIDIAMSLFPS